MATIWRQVAAKTTNRDGRHAIGNVQNRREYGPDIVVGVSRARSARLAAEAGGKQLGICPPHA